MSSDYVAPGFMESGFNCIWCGAFTQQEWHPVYFGEFIRRLGVDELVAVTGHRGDATIELVAARCTKCKDFTVWRGEQLIYPSSQIGDLPSPDMPDSARHVYLEARLIASNSPRGAAALLRLAAQMICIHLGGKGSNLNEDIGILNARGLPIEVQQAMDSLRIYGNNGAHPGEIDLSDDLDTVGQLFMCLNIIVDRTITQPRKLQELMSGISQGQKDQIVRRTAQHAQPNP